MLLTAQIYGRSIATLTLLDGARLAEAKRARQLAYVTAFLSFRAAAVIRIQSCVVLHRNGNVALEIHALEVLHTCPILLTFPLEEAALEFRRRGAHTATINTRT